MEQRGDKIVIIEKKLRLYADLWRGDVSEEIIKILQEAAMHIELLREDLEDVLNAKDA
jgi:hypothetical protein